MDKQKKQISQLSERLKGLEETSATLQQKVSELENKMRQQQHFETENLNNKVKDLQNKLKEREQEFESHSGVLQHKIEELEEKLKAKEQNAEDCILLHQKRLKRYGPLLESVVTITEELAFKQAKEADLLLSQGKQGPLHGIPYGLKDIIVVPHYNTTWGSTSFKDQVLDIEAWVYKRLKSAGAAIQQVRRKRLSTNSDTENNGVLPTSANNRTKQAAASDRKGSRQSDPPRPLTTGIARGMKSTTTTTTTAVNAHRPLLRNKTSRETIQGAKERHNKKRMWTR